MPPLVPATLPAWRGSLTSFSLLGTVRRTLDCWRGGRNVNTGRTKQITGMINITPEVLLEASGAKQSDGPEHQEALHDIGRACALRDIACLDAGVCVLGIVASITTGGMAAG